MRGASRNSESNHREPKPRCGYGTALFLACFSAALPIAHPISAQEPAPNRLSAEEAAQGFELLFDGTYESFHAHFVDYKRNDSTSDALGALWSVDTATQALVTKTASGPDARSRKKYRDFDFRVEYRCDGSQGISYRALLAGDRAWQTGVEYAFNDMTNLGKDNPGAAYDLYAPNPIPYNPFNTGKWNTARIVAIGDSVEHWLNGVKVVGYRYHSPDFWAHYDMSQWNAENRLTNKQAGNRNSGYIEEGYLGIRTEWSGRWQLRNMRINEKHPAFGPAETAGIVRSRARAGKPSSRPCRKSPTPAFPIDGKSDATLDGKLIPAGTARDRALD
jgi:hypothetical protein